MNFRYRLWFSKGGHLFFLLSLAAVLIATYYAAHGLLRKHYQASVANLLTSTLQLYQFQVSSDGASVVLSQAGGVIRGDLRDLTRAPFGLEKLESYRGVLNHHSGVAEQVTAYFRRQKLAAMAQHRTVNGGWVRFPATAFGHTNSTLFIELPASTFAKLDSLHLEEFVTTAPSLLMSGNAYSATNQSVMETGAGAEPVVNRAAQKARDMWSDLRGAIVDTPPELRTAIQAHFSNSIQDLVVQLKASGMNVASNSLSVLRPGTATLANVMAALSLQVQDDLRLVAEGETGSFWLMGRYRWWELIFWVWFGVATMGILKLTPHLLGQCRDKWEPRETMSVLAKLFYAPVLALVIFFALGYLGFGENEMAEFGRSSLVNLGIAFVLGLFPNTSFRIILDLCTKLFREDIREGEKKRPMPKVNKVTSEHTKNDDGTVYTIDNLKKNVFAHISAVAK